MNDGNILGAQATPASEQQGDKVVYVGGDPNNSSTLADEDRFYQDILPEYEGNISTFRLNLREKEDCPSDRYQRLQALQFRVRDEESGIVRKGNSPLAQQIRLINNQLNSKQVDLTYFWRVWNSPQRKDFIQGLEFVVKPDNWPLLRMEYDRPLQLFLTIYDAKLAKASFVDELYPGLRQLVKKISAAVEFSSKELLRVQENTAMTLYEHYIEEIQSRSKHQGAFYIRDGSDPKNPLKIPIADFIPTSPLFTGSQAWADIFLRAGSHKRANIQREPAESHQIEIELKKLKDNRRILGERVRDGDGVLTPQDHLCCAQFLYFNYRVYNPLISICSVLAERRIAGLNEGEAPGGEMGQVLLDICALLNSGGGVLLFDTFRSYLQLWPKGDLLEEGHFKSIRQLFAEELRSIHPPVRLDEHIFLSKVPVVRHPINEGLPSTGRNYIEGLFVLRVVVKPRQEGAEQVYVCLKDGSPRLQVAVVDNGARKLLVGMEGLRFIKRKFNHFYVPEQDYTNEEEFAMLRKPYSLFIDHLTCLQPEPGMRLSGNFSSAKGPQRKPQQDLQKKFKYLTLLVATRANHGTILQRLRAKGIQCQIMVKYLQYRFKAANNSAALFHNIRFDQLLSEVAYKKEFEFNGRFILTILVTDFIRLTDRNKGNVMPEDEFETLKSWLKTEHPNETLTIWRVTVQEKSEKEQYEFYLQTGGKLAMLFMYYVLNHYGQKCSFKNPKNYQKMTQGEREMKLYRFYPRR